MKASDGKVVYVLYVSKGGPPGAKNPSEMGPMRGSKSLAFWGRWGQFPGGGWGSQIAPTPVSTDAVPIFGTSYYTISLDFMA